MGIFPDARRAPEGFAFLGGAFCGGGFLARKWMDGEGTVVGRRSGKEKGGWMGWF